MNQKNMTNTKTLASNPMTNNRTVGDVVWAEPNMQPVGHEERKKRPYLLIRMIDHGYLWEVAPISTNHRNKVTKNIPYLVQTLATGKNSVVHLNHRTTISYERFEECIGHVSPEEMNEVINKTIALFTKASY